MAEQDLIQQWQKEQEKGINKLNEIYETLDNLNFQYKNALKQSTIDAKLEKKLKADIHRAEQKALKLEEEDNELTESLNKENKKVIKQKIDNEWAELEKRKKLFETNQNLYKELTFLQEKENLEKENFNTNLESLNTQIKAELKWKNILHNKLNGTLEKQFNQTLKINELQEKNIYFEKRANDIFTKQHIFSKEFLKQSEIKFSQSLTQNRIETEINKKKEEILRNIEEDYYLTPMQKKKLELNRKHIEKISEQIRKQEHSIELSERINREKSRAWYLESNIQKRALKFGAQEISERWENFKRDTIVGKAFVFAKMLLRKKDLDQQREELDAKKETKERIKLEAEKPISDIEEFKKSGGTKKEFQSKMQKEKPAIFSRAMAKTEAGVDMGYAKPDIIERKSLTKKEKDTTTKEHLKETRNSNKMLQSMDKKMSSGGALGALIALSAALAIGGIIGFIATGKSEFLHSTIKGLMKATYFTAKFFQTIGKIGKLAGKIVGKLAGKETAKVAGKIAETGLEKGGGKLAAKLSGKFGLKALKLIPGVGAVLGIIFGINRWKKGDKIGGLLEMASGFIGLIPGLGMPFSLAIDAFLLLRDFKGVSKEEKLPEVKLGQSKEELKKIPAVGSMISKKRATTAKKSKHEISGPVEVPGPFDLNAQKFEVPTKPTRDTAYFIPPVPTTTAMKEEPASATSLVGPSIDWELRKQEIINTMKAVKAERGENWTKFDDELAPQAADKIIKKEKNRLNIPKPMATGGIAISPQTRLIGEAGPEAVVPLDRFEEVYRKITPKLSTSTVKATTPAQISELRKEGETPQQRMLIWQSYLSGQFIPQLARAISGELKKGGQDNDKESVANVY